MSNREMKVVKGRNPRQKSRNLKRDGRRTGGSISKDNALILRSEYQGQPTYQVQLAGLNSAIVTTVTTGQVAVNLPLSSAQIPDFSTRFAGFTEFRIVKALAKTRFFSTQTPGLLRSWFSEDDTAAPSLQKAEHAKARTDNFADVMGVRSLAYVPHDPAQQTWTLVSSGAPVIGYYKMYSDNGQYGAPIVATVAGLTEMLYTVQFRGLI